MHVHAIILLIINYQIALSCWMLVVSLPVYDGNLSFVLHSSQPSAHLACLHISPLPFAAYALPAQRRHR